MSYSGEYAYSAEKRIATLERDLAQLMELVSAWHDAARLSAHVRPSTLDAIEEFLVTRSRIVEHSRPEE